ncbi:MAG: aspartate kinase [Muribaculaceae bacterium]|nr:aspartate kinase [Muribaculaceae bacterium]
MKVLKFGGTSVGSVESLNNVKKIVESISGEAVIVVSALGGLTDKLIATAKMAAEGDSEWLKEMDAISLRHHDIIKNVVSNEKQSLIKSAVDEHLTELKRNYEGVFLLRSLPEKVLDVIVSFGERMSSIIVAAMVDHGKRYYSPDFIKTEKWYGKNIADRKLTDKLIKETLGKLGKNEKAIIPGFISTDSTTGEITNLGRGGSDYTGALIAAALGAEILEIWTDVDGFMTADPRIVKDALIIDHLTFTESMELCTFGAKVIYPPTIYPVFHSNIPIKILNTFNPDAPGTLITDQAQQDDLEVKGVTSLKDVALITINIKSFNDIKDPLKRALNTLSRQAVRIIPVANPDPYTELNFAVTASDAEVSLEMLEKEFAPEISSGKIEKPILKGNLAAVALVGIDMRSRSRLAARIGHSLRRQGINVEAYSAGNSDTTLIYIINQEKSDEALPLIHSLVFEL